MQAFVTSSTNTTFLRPSSIPIRPHRFLSARRTSLAKRHYTRKYPMATAAAPPLDEGIVFFAKAGPDGTSMGDCPFTMKANLALRFKGTEFNTYFIDTGNKPAWYLDLNEEGTTPTLIDGTMAIGDSEEIVEYADKIGVNKHLKLSREDDDKWDAAFDAVSPLFGSLVRLLKNKEEEKEAELKQALTDAIDKLEAFLTEGKGPYLLGDQISALDCNLAPKLNHIMVAAGHYKAFEIPEKCVKVKQFMNTIKATEEWKASTCPDDVIIWGWSKFFK